MGYSAHRKITVKERILLSMLKGSSDTTSIIGDMDDVVGTTILHEIKQLLQNHFIAKSTDGVYSLTSLGLFEAQLCERYNLASATMETFRDFWLHHDVAAIPPELMVNIGALSDAKIIHATPVDLDSVHSHFIELLSSAKTIMGASPVFHPDYVLALSELLNNGVKIQLIVTPEILAKIKQVGSDLILVDVCPDECFVEF